MMKYLHFTDISCLFISELVGKGLEEVIDLIKILSRKLLFDRFDSQCRLLTENYLSIIGGLILFGKPSEIGLILFLCLFNIFHMIFPVVSHSSFKHSCFFFQYSIDHAGVKILSLSLLVSCLPTTSDFLCLLPNIEIFLGWQQILVFFSKTHMFFRLNFLSILVKNLMIIFIVAIILSIMGLFLFSIVSAIISVRILILFGRISSTF